MKYPAKALESEETVRNVLFVECYELSRGAHVCHALSTVISF